jgi:hypothetical protein
MPGNTLRGSDLSGSDLSGSNLRGSDLRGSNLSDSDLRGSDLRDSDLRGSNLRGSNLSGSDLRDSNLNWNSHDILSEILRQAAKGDANLRRTAGLVACSHDWCWQKLIAIATPSELAFAQETLRPWYDTHPDDAPEHVKRFFADAPSAV